MPFDPLVDLLGVVSQNPTVHVPPLTPHTAGVASWNGLATSKGCDVLVGAISEVRDIYSLQYRLKVSHGRALKPVARVAEEPLRGFYKQQGGGTFTLRASGAFGVIVLELHQ